MTLQIIPEQQDQRLITMLSCIADRVEAEGACVITRDFRGNIEILASWGAHLPDSDQLASAESWLSGWLRVDIPGGRKARVVHGTPIDDDAIAVVYPFETVGDEPGCVILTAPTGAYDDATLDALAPLVDIVQAMMENRYLAQASVTAAALAATTQAVSRDPSPQNIVAVMRDNIFNSDVCACAIGQYVDRSGGDDPGDFKTLEIMGTWSRQFGSGFGVGMRYEFDDRYPVGADIPDDGLYFDGDKLDELLDSLDSFSRESFQAMDAKALMIVPLRTEMQEIGVLTIVNAIANEPGPAHVRTYQIVSEFLALGTTAGQLAEQREIEARGRAALLDSVTDGVIMILPDTQSTVLTVNTQFIEMFHLNPNDSHRVPLAELIQRMRISESARRELSATWGTLGGSSIETRDGEFKMRVSGGVLGEIAWYSAPVYQDARVSGRIFTFQDISADRAAEEMRDELLRRISHELRTPLTSIQGFAQVMLDDNSLPDDHYMNAQMIFNSADHLKLIVGDIVQITHAISGKLTLDLTSANLNDIVIAVVALLKVQSQARNQTVFMEIDDETLPAVTVDVNRMTQVLTNLVANAIKFGPPDSTIRVITQHITSAGKLPAGAPVDDIIMPCVLVSVLDEGEGLRRADLERIFDPFYRSERVQGEQIEGAGLGLAVAHSLLERHRGSLWAQPATRRKPGGRFFFTLPAGHE